MCWDTTNNATCNATWVDVGGALTLTVTAVAPGTYWWQVKTVGGGVEADDGAWRALTMVAAPSFGKQAPATGTTGLGNNLTLTWSAYGQDGYWVCWDTVHNNACDTLWWPASTATTGLENLAPGTYYWQVKTGVTGVLADGGTWWSFTVTTPLVPPDHWKAEYFGNQDLSGTPVAVVDEGTGFVDHSWGDGGPAGLADHFSARFTRTVTLPAGRYRFTVTTDDGSRLWVDGQLTIDAWWPQGPTGHTAEVDLGAGEHVLRYEYFEQTGGATARLTWALLTPVVLASGEALWENQTRVSLDGAYRLQYQGDGNLVVVRLADESCAWSSQTNGTSVGATIMQGDGNLVVYNADWIPVWNSGTAGYDGARLEIANHTMAIVGPDGTTRWAVSLAAAPAPRPSAAGIAPGAVPPTSTGAAPGSAGFLLLVVALFGLGARAVRRLWGMVGPPAASRKPQAGHPMVAHLRATALLLTAMLLVPATALAQIPTQQVEYYHTDALGSVRAVTKQVNGTWQVVARHDYMPFGEEVAPPTPPQGKRLFTGKERDNETGLDYFEARHLMAGLGRFTTVDPAMVIEENLVDPQRWIRYVYVRNSPLRFRDPDGRRIRLGSSSLLASVASLVPADVRNAVRLTDDGFIDSAALNQADCDSPAFNALRLLANSTEVVRVDVTDTASLVDAAGATQQIPLSKDSWQGVFVPARPGDNPNTEGRLRSGGVDSRVYLPADMSILQLSEALRHELLGHAFLFISGLKWQHELPPVKGAVNDFIYRVVEKLWVPRI